MAVAGEVLEHRQHARVAQARHRRRRTPSPPGVIAERPVADHIVVGLVGDVDDRREVDRDAQSAHRLAACKRDAYTSSGVSRRASTRGDGCTPISDDSRDTRPPSSSTPTASGSVRGGRWSAHRLTEHRQVGPAADEDAADVIVGHHRAGVSGAGHTDHQQLRQLVARRHARQAARLPSAAGRPVQAG